MTAPRNAIVLVLDRLNPSFIGPYGNTWIDTPRMNRLASQSFLFEHVMADSPRLETAYRSFWQGTHAAAGDEHAGDRSSNLAALLHAAGVQTTLVTDQPELAESALASDVDERSVWPVPAPTAAAANVEETHLAQLFAAAIDVLRPAPSPRLVWIHAQAMNAGWDAPTDFRRQFADEDDPLAPDFVAPPRRRLADDFDPDELLGVTHAYAGQIVAADLLLGAFLDVWEQSETADRTLLIFTSPRGYPLGEHRRVGPCDEALYGELTGCPLMIRLPDGRGWCERSQALVQPPDVCDTLLDWFEVNEPARRGNSLLPIVRGETPRWREAACAVSAKSAALRTPAWLWLQHSAAQQLFVKPDDRWEANDVADRCREVAEQLKQAFHDFQTAARSGHRNVALSLNDVLRHGLE